MPHHPVEGNDPSPNLGEGALTPPPNLGGGWEGFQKLKSLINPPSE